jgi:RNA polymerase sigma factor (sigma-70 family)
MMNDLLRSRVASFEALYRGERPRLIRYLMSLGASQHQADDAVQVSFARAWDRWDTIRHPRAWLYTVALHESGRARAADSGREIPAGDALPDTVCVPDAGDLVILNEEEERVLAALANLPLRQRQVMSLAIAGFTAAEIAAELGCQAAAVRQSQVKARDKLARQLGIDRRKHR